MMISLCACLGTTSAAAAATTFQLRLTLKSNKLLGGYRIDYRR